MDAILVLQDGPAFRGRSFGAAGETFGELVFNTSMTGYQEVLSDPSYRGQIVTMTYPLVGNYGVNEQDFESSKLHLSGFVVREYCDRPSNHRATRSLGLFLKEHKVVGISEVDTRQITRSLRDRGCVPAIISTDDFNIEALRSRLAASPSIAGRDLVREVATRRTYRFRESAGKSWYDPTAFPDRRGKPRHKLAVIDYGMKSNIARLMVAMGAEVTVYPPDTTAATLIGKGHAGVLLSNGPGDPTALPYAVETAGQLVGKLPVFGICLGHQILGLALGGKVTKLKFGHHGGNHPVKHLDTGKVLITSQNHNYAVTEESLDSGVRVTHRNLNDGTVEGLAHLTHPVWSVQYHPEAAPGPHDALVHFASFFAQLDADAKA